MRYLPADTYCFFCEGHELLTQDIWQSNRLNVPIYRKKNLTDLSLTLTEKLNHHNMFLELCPKLTETNFTDFLYAATTGSRPPGGR